ncbi:MAG: hypothetical protein ACREIO_07390, partial [Nitrospiraceae bacterium]
MKRQTITTLALLMTATLLWPVYGLAQSMSDYTAYPPFINQVTPPNVLFIADMTSTMKEREYGAVAFAAGTTFYGLFDPMKCYDEDSAAGRFEPASPAKGSIAATCPGKWDGNFLNWAALRRADAAKKAMTGGSCVGLNPPRDVDGNCKFSGSPSLPTVTHQTLFTGSSGNDQTTGAVPSATYTGRIPVPPGGPASLYFHILGTGTDAGYMCVGTDTSCGASDQKFRLRVALEIAPRGVLQDF